MDFISILATVILFITIATLVVALAAYGAYKVRERQRVKAKVKAEAGSDRFEPVFLEPYTPAASGPRRGQ